MESETSTRLVQDADDQDSVRTTVSARLNQRDHEFAPQPTFEPLVMTAVTSDNVMIGGLRSAVPKLALVSNCHAVGGGNASHAGDGRLSYFVSAAYWDESKRQRLEGRVGPFVVTGNLPNVRVTLSEITSRAP